MYGTQRPHRHTWVQSVTGSAYKGSGIKTHRGNNETRSQVGACHLWQGEEWMFHHSENVVFPAQPVQIYTCTVHLGNYLTKPSNEKAKIFICVHLKWTHFVCFYCSLVQKRAATNDNNKDVVKILFTVSQSPKWHQTNSLKPSDSSFTIMDAKEKQQIFTFKKLEQKNVFCHLN